MVAIVVEQHPNGKLGHQEQWLASVCKTGALVGWSGVRLVANSPLCEAK
uniref:Uncharacterized protein n=1 Tax=Arundo donax TaxID=35708 RepID=A0A0A9AYI9_ARUDO